MTKRQTLRFVGACYGIVLVGWLLVCLACFVQDMAGRAAGTLCTQEYTFDTVQTQEIAVQSATQAITSGYDPQLILSDFTGRAVEVHMEIVYSAQPGEVNLYYKRAGEEFSNAKKVWGKRKSDGTYVFTLPRTRIDALRIDPTNLPGLSMTLVHFTLNPPRSFFSYFACTWEDGFNFIVYPGLFAACAGYVCAQTEPLWKKRFASLGEKHYKKKA